MSDISEQKVMVVCDFTDRMKDVILHGARFADILKKELCLLAVWKNRDHQILVHQNLKATTQSLKSKLPSLQISSLLIKGSLRDNMVKIAKEYNAVLLILHQADIKSTLSAFRESYIAFLYVNGSEAINLRYKNVLVPLDYRKASKESALWASYLGRFNQSLVSVVYAKEKITDQAEKLSKNLNFMKKLFANLKVSHQLVQGKSGSWGIFNETLSRSVDLNGDVMVLVGSTYISFIDRIIGLPEEKMVKKAGHLSVLIINPQKEICVLCD